MPTYKTETWKRRGSVEVSRNAKGQFVSWHVFIPQVFGKKVAMYGHVIIRGRYAGSRRYEFSGRGKHLQRAIILAHNIVPKTRFVSASASDFLSNPYSYGVGGYWYDKEVNS